MNHGPEMTTILPADGADTVATPAGPVARWIDGGDLDCGSGLLLLITRSMRRLPEGGRLGIRSAEPSVTVDLPAWAELVGHAVAVSHAESEAGPWWFVVEKAGQQSRSVFTTGETTPRHTGRFTRGAGSRPQVDPPSALVRQHGHREAFIASTPRGTEL